MKGIIMNLITKVTIVAATVAVAAIVYQVKNR
jgi:hypothetical protein